MVITCLRTGCGTPIADGANYCHRCGLEVRQICPKCKDTRERRLLAPYGDQSPWCLSCDALLAVCEKCGRWLLPGETCCPGCEVRGIVARVLPAYPQHTGRRWDGCGTAVGNAVPWDFSPKVVNTKADTPPYPTRIYWEGKKMGAFALCHGRLYILDEVEDQTFTLTSRLETPEALKASAPSDQQEQKIWEIQAALAEKVEWNERLAPVGSALVLSGSEGFLSIDVSLRDQGAQTAVPLGERGKPLTQVGGPWGWSGWLEIASEPTLWIARTTPYAGDLQAKRIPTSSSSCLALQGRMVQRDGKIYWPGQDGALWSLNLQKQNSVPEAITPPIIEGKGVARVWAGISGPGLSWISNGEIYFASKVGERLYGPHRLSQRNVRSTGQDGRNLQQAIIKDRLLLAFEQNYHFYGLEKGSPFSDSIPHQPGEVKALCLTKKDGRECRWILSLLQDQQSEQQQALLIANSLDPVQNADTFLARQQLNIVWRRQGVAALGLIVVDNRIYIAHKRGIDLVTE